MSTRCCVWLTPSHKCTLHTQRRLHSPPQFPPPAPTHVACANSSHETKCEVRDTYCNNKTLRHVRWFGLHTGRFANHFAFLPRTAQWLIQFTLYLGYSDFSFKLRATFSSYCMRITCVLRAHYFGITLQLHFILR